MPTIRYSCFWPGLASAWYRGAAHGLFVAVVFSWAVSLSLLATFVWPEWLSGWLLTTLWVSIATVWLVESIRNQFQVRRLLDPVGEGTSEAFEEAQQQYLRGNWFEAEAILLEMVHQHPRDIAAGLLLVGVLRHTQRWRPALRRLEQLGLLDAAAGWRYEIEKEKRLIERSMREEREQRQGAHEANEETSKGDAGVEEPGKASESDHPHNGLEAHV